MGKQISNKTIGGNLLKAALVAGIITVPMINANAVETPEIRYRAHTQDIGWMKQVSSSDSQKFAGTRGESRRLEALEIELVNLDEVTLSFDVHVQNIGDMKGLSTTDVIGTTGKALRLEAITVYADGLKNTDYVLQYQCHIQNEGDSGWKNAGEECGSRGKSQRLEGIEFKLVSKTELALEDAKIQAIAKLKEDYKASDYTLNAKAYETAMKNAENEINDAVDLAGVKTTLVAQIDILKEIPTDKKENQDLDAKKGAAKVEFSRYVNGQYDAVGSNSSLTAAEKVILKNSIMSSKTYGEGLIDSATTGAGVKTAVINSVKNVISSTNKEVGKLLDNLYANGNGAATPKYLVSAKYEEGKTALRDATKTVNTAAATNVNDTTYAITTANVALTNIIKAYTDVNVAANLKTIAELKTAAVDELTGTNGYVKSLTGTYANVAASEISSGKSAINVSVTSSAIGTALKNAKINILTAVKNYTKGEVEKLYNNGKAIKGVLLTTETYNTFNDAINPVEYDTTTGSGASVKNAVTIVIEAHQAVTTDNTLVAKITTAMNGLNTYANTHHKRSDIEYIVVDAEKKMNNEVAIESDINTIKTEAERAILANERAYYVGVFTVTNGTGKTVENKYFTKEECDAIVKNIKNAATPTAIQTIYTNAIA